MNRPQENRGFPSGGETPQVLHYPPSHVKKKIDINIFSNKFNI